MILVFPLKSESTLKQWPYLTLGLIALNIFIWLITSLVIQIQEKQLFEIRQQMASIEAKYMSKRFLSNPQDILKLDFRKHQERILSGEIIPTESPDYDLWITLYKEFQYKYSQTVFEKWGFKPSQFSIVKIFTSMFIHAGFWHVLFNMLFLWTVGCNLEEDMGWKEFLLLYIISGIFASLFHAFALSKSVIPCVGASGAVAGIMGAFIIRRYKTKIKFFYFIWLFIRPFFGTVSVYAYIVIPFWFLQQVFGAIIGGDGGVAFWAHIGGFVFGAGISVFFKSTGLVEPIDYSEDKPRFDAQKIMVEIQDSSNKGNMRSPENKITALLQILQEEPDNHEARLELARMHLDAGREQDAAVAYNIVVSTLFGKKACHSIVPLYIEMKNKKLLEKLTQENMFALAEFLMREEKNSEALHLFGLYIRLFAKAEKRPYAIYYAYQILKNRMRNEDMARRAFALFKKEYPHLIKKKTKL